jgi:hypothetical protein
LASGVTSQAFPGEPWMRITAGPVPPVHKGL